MVDWAAWTLRVGCPVWRSAGWVGTLYATASAQKQALQIYTNAFPTVEGNSTFYSLPSETLVTQWVEQAAPGFRFCFKVPREISHELSLRSADAPLQQFCSRLEPLLAAGRLGPIFLQLPPSFDAGCYPALETFIRRLPTAFAWSVELRHPDWFEGDTQKMVEALLRERGVDRVLLDSTVIHATTPRTDTERITRGRKPVVPRLDDVTGTQPMVRLIGRDLLDRPHRGVLSIRERSSEGYLSDAAAVIADWSFWLDRAVDWLKDGLRPYFFVHTPDDRHAPVLCHAFYEAVRDRAAAANLSLPALPPLLSDADSSPKQRTLFDL